MEGERNFSWPFWQRRAEGKIWAAERGKGKEQGGLERREAERAERERKAQLGGGGEVWEMEDPKRNHNLKYRYLKFMEKSVENCSL